MKISKGEPWKCSRKYRSQGKFLFKNEYRYVPWMTTKLVNYFWKFNFQALLELLPCIHE
jgi:hypothetical protein